MNDLPILRPLPIATRHEFPWVRIKNWLTVVRKWEVMEDWFHQLPAGPRILIPKGFIFDGASIPRFLWGFLSPTGLLLQPGLIHDYAYRYDYLWAKDLIKADDEELRFYRYNDGAGQAIWDKIFYQVGEQVNGISTLDGMAWAALSVGGRFAWRANRKRHAKEIYPTGYKGAIR